MRHFTASLLLAVLIMLETVPAWARQTLKPDTLSSSTLSGLKLRPIGPAATSGRISWIAVNPQNTSEAYVSAASGGVWKTANAGISWSSVFDNEGSYSIGTVTIDPKNPSIVWVGTGENNSQRSVSYGDGVYRSEDGGKSWKNMGLKHSEHIARILIDPRNSSIVYVAAQGPLWGPGGDRGLFKTTDAGKTWNAVLTVSENTGVTDVVMDPKDPDLLIAASYQRRRHVWTLIDGGPECGLHRSTDGGATWTKVRSGLPGADLGRIGLAMSPADPRVVYALIEAAQHQGGVFRSSDRGVSWEKRNDFDATAMYYGTIYADPKDPDRIYVMNMFIMASDDGGRTLKPLPGRATHVDYHSLWIEPGNTDHYLTGNDGGLYESFDRGQTWRHMPNLPVTQFYDVTVDNASPFYNVYGGTQDNGSLGGPSRTKSWRGIVNSDWFITQGGDGFQSRVDPEDPSTVYAESQYAGLVRYDRRTGEQVGIQPMEGKGEEPLRFNWDSPLIISQHSHTRLYLAANKLFRSDDRGDSWRAVSGNLHRPIDRNSLPVMGKVWGPDAVAKNMNTSFYGNGTALSESPLKEGLIYAGTDDGVIQVTEDGGMSWRKIEKFPGVPETTYVSRLLASQHDINTVYASFDNHKMADFAPYILRSTDAGRSWTPIKANLPANGPVLAIAEDHVNPSLLFAGTEFGLFFTVNGGQKWIQLKNDLPTIAVRDLAIQKRENDLVLATFGRGFYILDDYSPLRTFKSETISDEAIFYPVKDPLLYIRTMSLGAQGESFYSAPNPPFGATFTYYLKEALKTKKEKRQEAEREVEKKKITPPYPTMEQLRAEDEEEPPAFSIVVSDAYGAIVRRLPAANSKGISRATWDLRYPAAIPAEGGGGEGGALVMPGEYRAALYKRVEGVTTQVAGPQSFTVTVEGLSAMTSADRKALVEFQQKAVRLQRAFSGSLQMANDVKSRLTQIKQVLQETPVRTDSLFAASTALETRINAILLSMRGDNFLRSRNENAPSSISDRIWRIVDDLGIATAKPPQTHIDAYNIANDEFTAELAKLRSLTQSDLPALEKALEAAGSPWTPGRIPDWKED